MSPFVRRGDIIFTKVKLDWSPSWKTCVAWPFFTSN
jgi:hypothetical protein